MNDLSILIPARNEMFLEKTISDILEHKRGDTQIIAVLDGAWSSPTIPQHPSVTIIHTPSPIGQRAATNLAARLSQTEFIMKLDGHCAVAEGFDLALLEAARELGPLATQVPSQWNLHAFDWICQSCQMRKDQGPTPTDCSCGSPNWYREMVWTNRRLTEFWRFDSDLKFSYWGEFKNRDSSQSSLAPTLSCLGACWFLSRDRFWDLGGLDEAHGSWGQMGTEIACKSWLSGGSLMTNRRTWYAHMFRTQGGDFSFPYPLSMSDVEKARAHSKNLWLNNQWPKQVHSLKWLVEKFAPIPGWTQEQIDALPDASHD